MNIQPTGDLVVIRPIAREMPKSAGGILLPASEEAQESPYQGVVVACGLGKYATLSEPSRALVDAARKIPELAALIEEFDKTQPRISMTVKVGDTVIYSRNGWQSFRIDGEDVVVCGEASIMGVVENDD